MESTQLTATQPGVLVERQQQRRSVYRCLAESRCIEVQNANLKPAGGTFRAPNDDTYGNGELIVVSVEFSEPVIANSDNMTFRDSDRVTATTEFGARSATEATR